MRQSTEAKQGKEVTADTTSVAARGIFAARTLTGVLATLGVLANFPAIFMAVIECLSEAFEKRITSDES